MAVSTLHYQFTSSAKDLNLGSFGSDQQEEDVCAICLLALLGQSTASPESCNHIFCLDCILEWAKHVRTCPVDRKPFVRLKLQNLANSLERSLNLKSGASVPLEDLLPPGIEPGQEEDATFLLETLAHVVCQTCAGGDREDELLLCDSCDRGYHLDCLHPPLAQVPAGDWLCPRCLEGGTGSALRRRSILRTAAAARVRAAVEGRREQMLARVRATTTSTRRPAQRRKTCKKATRKSKFSTTTAGKRIVRSVKRRKTKRRTRRVTKRKPSVRKEIEIPVESARKRIARSLGLVDPRNGHAHCTSATHSPLVAPSGKGKKLSSWQPTVQLDLFGARDALSDASDEEPTKAHATKRSSSPPSSADLLGAILASQAALIQFGNKADKEMALTKPVFTSSVRATRTSVDKRSQSRTDQTKTSPSTSSCKCKPSRNPNQQSRPSGNIVTQSPSYKVRKTTGNDNSASNTKKSSSTASSASTRSSDTPSTSTRSGVSSTGSGRDHGQDDDEDQDKKPSKRVLPLPATAVSTGKETEEEDDDLDLYSDLPQAEPPAPMAADTSSAQQIPLTNEPEDKVVPPVASGDEDDEEEQDLVIDDKEPPEATDTTITPEKDGQVDRCGTPLFDEPLENHPKHSDIATASTSGTVSSLSQLPAMNSLREITPTPLSYLPAINTHLPAAAAAISALNNRPSRPRPVFNPPRSNVAFQSVKRPLLNELKATFVKSLATVFKESLTLAIRQRSQEDSAGRSEHVPITSGLMYEAVPAPLTATYSSSTAAVDVVGLKTENCEAIPENRSKQVNVKAEVVLKTKGRQKSLVADIFGSDSEGESKVTAPSRSRNNERLKDAARKSQTADEKKKIQRDRANRTSLNSNKGDAKEVNREIPHEKYSVSPESCSKSSNSSPKSPLCASNLAGVASEKAQISPRLNPTCTQDLESCVKTADLATEDEHLTKNHGLAVLVDQAQFSKDQVATCENQADDSFSQAPPPYWTEEIDSPELDHETRRDTPLDWENISDGDEPFGEDGELDDSEEDRKKRRQERKQRRVIEVTPPPSEIDPVNKAGSGSGDFEEGEIVEHKPERISQEENIAADVLQFASDEIANNSKEEQPKLMFKKPSKCKERHYRDGAEIEARIEVKEDLLAKSRQETKPDMKASNLKRERKAKKKRREQGERLTGKRRRYSSFERSRSSSRSFSRRSRSLSFSPVRCRSREKEGGEEKKRYKENERNTVSKKTKLRDKERDSKLKVKSKGDKGKHKDKDEKKKKKGDVDKAVFATGDNIVISLQFRGGDRESERKKKKKKKEEPKKAEEKENLLKETGNGGSDAEVPNKLENVKDKERKRKKKDKLSSKSKESTVSSHKRDKHRHRDDEKKRFTPREDSDGSNDVRSPPRSKVSPAKTGPTPKIRVFPRLRIPRGAPILIDLDTQAVLKVEPAISDVILVSDSDEDLPATKKPRLDSSKPSKREECRDPPPKSTPSKLLAGPKTPPEPTVKFTLVNKRPVLPFVNPLCNEDEDENNPQEEAVATVTALATTGGVPAITLPSQLLPSSYDPDDPTNDSPNASSKSGCVQHSPEPALYTPIHLPPPSLQLPAHLKVNVSLTSSSMFPPFFSVPPISFNPNLMPFMHPGHPGLPGMPFNPQRMAYDNLNQPRSATMFIPAPVRPLLVNNAPARQSYRGQVSAAASTVTTNSTSIVTSAGLMEATGAPSPTSSEGSVLLGPPSMSPPSPTPSQSMSPPLLKASGNANMFDHLFSPENSKKAGKSLNYSKGLTEVKSREKSKAEKNLPSCAGKLQIQGENGKPVEELPGSAADLMVKEKFLVKLNRQERVIEEVKLALKPYYHKKLVSKEDYKEILRRAVPKVCHTKSGEINPAKIKQLVEGYVRKFRHMQKKTVSSTSTGVVPSQSYTSRKSKAPA